MNATPITTRYNFQFYSTTSGNLNLIVFVPLLTLLLMNVLTNTITYTRNLLWNWNLHVFSILDQCMLALLYRIAHDAYKWSSGGTS